MPTWLIVLLAVLVVLVVGLFVLGELGARRRDRERDAAFRAELGRANEALAAARALDRGWERATLEDAARAAHERRQPGAQITDLHLVQVVDRPGTEEDQARFRVMDAHGEHDVLLGRRGDQWIEVS